MHVHDSKLLVSATDLSNFLACHQLTALDRLTALGKQAKPPKYDDPSLELLWARGLQHEQSFLEGLRERGFNVEDIGAPSFGESGPDWADLAAKTRHAMGRGVDVVYQGVLLSSPWLGRPDFLLRVDTPSDLGDWSYEVADTKLARDAKAGAVLQIALYSQLLAEQQGINPEWMTLALGGPGSPEERLRYSDFSAYLRMVGTRLAELMRVDAEEAVGSAPEPCDHCRICAWRSRCDDERRAADHLSLVAGITRQQRTALQERSVNTLAELAALPLPIEPPLSRVGRIAAERVRQQARIQHDGREAGEHLYEFLRPVEADRGFCVLPEPSDGDLFFDFEGSPHFEDEGLEYLFGWVDQSDEYSALWAHDRSEEKLRFQEFIDFVMARREAFPDMHIYHYAPYEPAALKRLMGRHGTREDEVDSLLKEGVFIDLYRVVRQGLRASVESYSIKKMEPFYDFERDVDLRRASSALALMEVGLATGSSGEDLPLLEEVAGYNEDDCRSTRLLRDWLEERRKELGVDLGHDVPRPTARDLEEERETPEHLERTEAIVSRLVDGLKGDPSAWGEEQRARWIMAQLLNWHRREKKSTWWQYYTWLEMTDEELVEDRETVGALSYVGEIEQIKRSLVHRYRHPRQEHSIRVGDRPRAAVSGAGAGTVVAIDEAERTIDLKKGIRGEFEPATGLLPLDDVKDQVIRESLLCIGEAICDHGLDDSNPFPAAMHLLMRRPPRVSGEAGASESLRRGGESNLDAAIRLVGTVDRSVLPIQGPPGTGKTFAGARAVLGLLADGKRVGLCATSHKVISNLLEEVCEAANEAGQSVAGIQRASEANRCSAPDIEIGSNSDVHEALKGGQVQLAAGTAWLWSRPEMQRSVDVLVIDEAGQFSLANALGVAAAAESLVLLGDPRQLEQPQRGVHPPGADASALDHLLHGEQTIPPERGLFLSETWRLHPEITGFTSELFYRSRLTSAEGTEIQTVYGGGGVEGTGLRYIPVVHKANRNEAPEEVEAITKLVAQLIEAAPRWTDRAGDTKTLTQADILIVAPYNVQVAAIRDALDAAGLDGVPVGTVDKFQGQEAPIALFSTTSSSGDDAPRGMGFLYSPNRLNVATSRAKCLAVVLGSPALFVPDCSSPKQMRLANAYCRLREMALVVDG